MLAGALCLVLAARDSSSRRNTFEVGGWPMVVDQLYACSLHGLQI